MHITYIDRLWFHFHLIQTILNFPLKPHIDLHIIEKSQNLQIFFWIFQVSFSYWYLVKFHFHLLAYFIGEAMATHSSTLAWKIPWTKEPGRLQSMGSLRVGHDWATSFHFSLSCIGEGNGNPLQCFYLENPRDRGAWCAAVCGVAQSRIQLKQLSSSSSL